MYLCCLSSNWKYWFFSKFNKPKSLVILLVLPGCQYHRENIRSWYRSWYLYFFVFCTTCIDLKQSSLQYTALFTHLRTLAPYCSSSLFLNRKSAPWGWIKNNEDQLTVKSVKIELFPANGAWLYWVSWIKTSVQQQLRKQGGAHIWLVF